MTEVTGRQHRRRKKKSRPQSAVSPFVSVATKPIPFSPFWCYFFMWYITGVSFGVCLFFSFFLRSRLQPSGTLVLWVKSCATGLNHCFVTEERSLCGTQAETQNQIDTKGQQRKASKKGRARVKTNITDVSCIIW